jgi:large subunit ribosomal protein L2
MNRITKSTRKCSQYGGRNHQGVTTVFHRGGGNKTLYRIVDFKRSLFNHPAIVRRIEYDPNRSSYIALVAYSAGMLPYILAPKNLSVGDQICAGPSAEIVVGSAPPVSCVPVGAQIHNIEMKPGRGGQLMRAAGTYATITKKDQKYVIIRLHSGKLYCIPSQAMATIGEVSRGNRATIKLTKAGQSRWRNRRPVVRGVAMNPIDHPHGGGEGRSKGGGHPVSP